MIIKNWLSSVQRFLNGSRQPRRSRSQRLNGGNSCGPQDIRPAVELLEDRALLSGAAQLVRDINTVAASADPSQLIDVNGTLFFVASTPTTGVELWKSDGTVAGTVLVKDIRPGIASSFAGYNFFATELTNVNGTLFFTANDGINGFELWKSDGTAAGTVLVKDINPGGGAAGSSFPASLTNVGGILFFAANAGINGSELWKPDGTAAGTVLVKDINLVEGISTESESSYPSYLTNVGGILFFTADDGINGRELSDRLRGEKPALKVIHCSGYTDEVLGGDSRLRTSLDFLEKPFDEETFLKRVRACLDVAG